MRSRATRCRRSRLAFFATTPSHCPMSLRKRRGSWKGSSRGAFAKIRLAGSRPPPISRWSSKNSGKNPSLDSRPPASPARHARSVGSVVMLAGALTTATALALWWSYTRPHPAPSSAEMQIVPLTSDIGGRDDASTVARRYPGRIRG